MIFSAVLPTNEAASHARALIDRGFRAIDPERCLAVTQSIPKRDHASRVLFEEAVRTRLGGIRTGELALLKVPTGTNDWILTWNQPEEEEL